MKELSIPGNSFLAVVDKVLKKKGMKAVYEIDKVGLILLRVEGFDYQESKNSGILGFLNGEEPGEGKYPLHEVEVKEGDKVSLAWIEQGIYKGDFKEKRKNSKGLSLILNYKIQKEDLEIEYSILV
tara:strand:- start:349 stop:726 length:378 start_codon:yes stop_codon:yes gene_type:complete